jgi:hypothetical protein
LHGAARLGRWLWLVAEREQAHADWHLVGLQPCRAKGQSRGRHIKAC